MNTKFNSSKKKRIPFYTFIPISDGNNMLFAVKFNMIVLLWSQFSRQLFWYDYIEYWQKFNCTFIFEIIYHSIVYLLEWWWKTWKVRPCQVFARWIRFEHSLNCQKMSHMIYHVLAELTRIALSMANISLSYLQCFLKNPNSKHSMA